MRHSAVLIPVLGLALSLAGSPLAAQRRELTFLMGANLTGANLVFATVTGVVWGNTTCPDGSNSDTNGGTCVGFGGGL